MLSFFFGVVKAAVFTAVILVASHLVQVRGKTVSAHVGSMVNWVSATSVAKTAKNSAQEARRFASDLVVTSKSGVTKKQGSPDPHISDEDQAELKDLIVRGKR